MKRQLFFPPVKAGNILFAALGLLLTACAPSEQDYVAQPTGTPAMEKTALVTSDDVRLPMRSWLPKHKPRAVIVAVHGFNDYSFAFEGTGRYFRRHGIAVYAYDQRGFGSAPQAGVWATQDNLVRDLAQCVSLMKAKYPHTPVYLLGESMGGAVTLVALANPAFPKVNGMILVAPAVWGADTMNPIFRAMLWTGAHTFPWKKLTGSELRILATNNIPLLRRMGLDPLVIKATRIDTVYGLVHLMDSAYESVPDDKTPTLLLYGAHDQVIPKEPIESSLTRFNEPVQFAYYPEGYHMLLRDLQGEDVMEDINHWIKYHDANLPSGFGKEHDAKTGEKYSFPEIP